MRGAQRRRVVLHLPGGHLLTPERIEEHGVQVVAVAPTGGTPRHIGASLTLGGISPIVEVPDPEIRFIADLGRGRRLDHR